VPRHWLPFVQHQPLGHARHGSAESIRHLLHQCEGQLVQFAIFMLAIIIVTAATIAPSRGTNSVTHIYCATRHAIAVADTICVSFRMRSNYFTQKVLPPMLMQPPPGTQAALMKSFGTDVKTVQGSAPSFAFGAQGTRGAPATMVPLPPSPSCSGSPMMPLGGASTPMSTSWSETSSTLGQSAVAQATSSQSRQSPIRTDSHLIQASMSRAAATSREKTNLMKAASMPAVKAESNLMKAASMPAVQAGGTGTSPQRGLSPEGSSTNVSIHERTQRPFRRLIAQGIGFSPEH